MRISNLLWEGITITSPMVCPDCEGTVRVLTSDGQNRILSCDQCAWSLDIKGKPWEGLPILTTAQYSRTKGTGRDASVWSSQSPLPQHWMQGFVLR